MSIFAPGLGQLIRRRWGAGVFFILIFVLSFLLLKTIWKGYNSGFVAVIIAFAAVWFLNIIDAYKGPVFFKPPCRLSCPVDLNTVGYINLLSHQRFSDALYLIADKTPLIGVLGHICHAPCEDRCSRSGYDEPVAIRHLKVAAACYGSLEFNREKTINKKVAIVGGGPAGLTCAYFLLNKGYTVSVFESLPYLGGMLRLVPEYRLPRETLDQEIKRIVGQGLDCHLSTPVGTAIPFAEIKNRFDAVFVAAGASQSAKLRIRGEDLKGVIYGLDFLKRINEGEKVNIGEEIAVIGGGNVAVDCARSALRLGAKKVNIVCLENRDLTSKDRMPAFECEITAAEEEGVVIHHSLGPKAILEKGGEAVGLETQRCISVYDKNGKFSPEFDLVCESPVIKADTIIIAIGQEQDLSFLPWPLPKKVVVAQMFNTVVEAVAGGRRAAVKIDRYLRGSVRYAIERMFSFEDPIKLIKVRQNPEHQARLKIEMLPWDKRKGVEIIGKIASPDAIQKEANRCLNCPYRFL